jgi:hypothetical protein
MEALQALDEVFADEPSICVTTKLQSWPCKVANATCRKQVELDLKLPCTCKVQCRHVFADSYNKESECVEALLSLRTERTQGKQSDESVWLFQQLLASRCRIRGKYEVLFRLDGVPVCEQYFVTALGFTFPNRRMQKYVRLIEVN